MPTSNKKKVKKPTKTTLVDELEVLAHSVEGLDKEAAFAAIHPLLESVDATYIRLGGILTVIRDHAWWHEEGYPTFKELLEGKIGLKYRKAMYLVQIYEDLINSGVTWGEVKSLGWCKLKEISPVITKDNVEEWVAKAQNLTVLQLREVVSKFKAQVLESTPVSPDTLSTTTTTLSIKCHEDQKSTIKQAIDKAKGEAHTEYDAVALEAVCINYLTGGKVTKPKSLKAVLEKYQPEEVLEAFGELWPDIEVTVLME